MLIKRYIMLNILSSNFFINRSLGMMSTSYKFLGTGFTNFLINRTVGDILTSGETIDSLLKDIIHHQEKNVFGISGFTIEALEVMDEKKIDDSLKVMLETI